MAEVIPVFGEEDVLAGGDILEIIGGIAPKALQTALGESYREADAWSMEEGDDSVFYSDEDAPQGKAIGTVNSEAEDISLEEDGHAEEIEHSDRAREDIGQKEVENEIKLEDFHSNDTNILSTGDGVVTLLNNTDSATKASSDDLTVFPPSPKITKEPASSTQPSETSQPPLVVNREPEKSLSVFRGDSQESKEVLSIPTLSKKKSSHPKSFNHLTSSKYSTVSYRKIRRGNTRQRVEEFEYMIMNL